MPDLVEVAGLQSLARASKAFAQAGDPGGRVLKRELQKSLNTETKRTRSSMRAAIRPALPQSGGLAADVLRSTRFTTSVSTSAGGNPGVRIRARGKRSIRRMNRSGSFRHPVHGNREKWVTQTVPGLAGFLDRPFEKSRPDLQRSVLFAIDRVRNQINRSM